MLLLCWRVIGVFEVVVAPQPTAVMASPSTGGVASRSATVGTPMSDVLSPINATSWLHRFVASSWKSRVPTASGVETSTSRFVPTNIAIEEGSKSAPMAPPLDPLPLASQGKAEAAGFDTQG